MNSEDPIPVQILEKNKQTSQANGTMIEIEGIHLKSIKQADVIQFIERHIAKWKNATVFVNKRECEPSEPPIVDKKIFRPDAKRREILGDVELIIKIAGAPLEEDDCGVSIYSKGVWYETTLAGNKGREMAQYIFGEIDVSKLDEDKSPIRAIDMSRSMQLNPSNELVLNIYGFIGETIDQVRRELLKEEKKRRESEDAKKLEKQAEEIAQVINDDFRDFRLKLAKARAKGSQGFDSGSSKIEKGTDPDDLIFGFDEPAEITGNSGDIGTDEGERVGGEEPRTLNPTVSPASPEADKLGKPAGGKGRRRSTSGGFRVEFKPMGEDSSRALYVGPERTIYINIEHPQLVAARGSKSVEDPVFLRLAFEVAFSEYCIALAHELDQRGEFIDTSDPIVTIRENVNRIARKAAQLYA
jgi:hypothetical protein